MRKKVGEDAARHWIRGMRSLASNLPISPFHLAAADDMESLLEEVLAYRKKKEWVGLTDEEILKLFGVNGTADSDWNALAVLKDAHKLLEAVKKKNA